MYTFHLRSRALLYLAAFALALYLWSYLSSLGQIQLNPYRHSHVNFKHLLIACIVSAQRGGLEVRRARFGSNLEISLKGKTREGAADLLTSGDKLSNKAMVNSLAHTFPGIRLVSEEKNLPASSEDVYPISVSKSLFNSAAFTTIPDNIDLPIDDLVIWIDPLDATKEYSEGLTQYVTTMVCVASKGVPIIGVIHQPFMSNTVWATRFGLDKRLLSLRNVRSSQQSSTLRLVISRSHKGHVQELSKKALDNVNVTEAAGSGFKSLELLKGHADIYLHTTYIKKWDVCAADAILRYATEGTMTTLRGEPIRYDFESDVYIKSGIFATANSSLVSNRKLLADKFFTN